VIGAVAALMVAVAPASAENPTPGDRVLLQQIFERPEFSRARLRNQGTLEQLIRRIKSWFEQLFGSRGAETYSVVTRFLVLMAAALVAGWAVLAIVARRRAAVRASEQPEPDSSAPKLDDPQEHLQRARAQLATDPRGALREGLLSLLSVLERKRLARPDRVKTNRELAQQLPTRGADPALTQAVEKLLLGYDQTFYSLEPVIAADAARFLDEVERLR
jgi:hypothetical protein